MTATESDHGSNGNGAVTEQVSKCIEAGRQVIEGAARPVREAVGAAKQRVSEGTEAGREAVHSAVDNMRATAESSARRIDETRSAIRQRAADYVEAGRETVDSVRAKVEPVVRDGKARAAAITANTKQAIRQRDANGAVAVFAQVVGAMLHVVLAVASVLYSIDFIAAAVRRVRESGPAKRAEGIVRKVDVPATLEYVPFVGLKLAAFVRSFTEEVKKNV